MRNNRSTWLSAAPLAVVMFMALACSQERAAVDSEVAATATAATATDIDTSPVTASTLQLQGEKAVEVTLVDYEIRMPATLPAGPIGFQITNSGQEEHSFEIEGNGIEKKLERPLKPLEVATLRADLEPGTYVVYCPHENHAERHNMRRQLTVTPSAENPATIPVDTTTTD